MIEFSDGMKFDTSGPLRIDERSDGFYVVGEGSLMAVASREEGEAWIAQKTKPAITMQVVGPIAGVWTPWADVLCRNCHDALGKEVTAKREIKWPAGEKRKGDGQGYCTQCGAPVWVHEEIARLTRLRKLVGGDMEQTGGMCAALALCREDGGKVVVTNLDGFIFIGTYKAGQWEEGGEGLDARELPSSTSDEDAAANIRVALTESLEGLS
jgi:hypothetical protein